MRALSQTDQEWLWTEVAHAVRTELPLATVLMELAASEGGTRCGQVACLLADGLGAGKSFSQAVAEYRRRFPPYVVPALEAGERSGRLLDVLESLRENATLGESLRHRLAVAMGYPIVIGLVGVAIHLFLLVWLMPQFAMLFEELEIWEWHGRQRWELCLLGVQVGLALLLFLPIAALLILYVLPSRCRPRWTALDRVRIRLPMVGRAARLICEWRWHDMMSLLLAAGVPEPDVVRMAGEATGNAHFDAQSRKLAERVSGGERLGEALDDVSLFEPILAWGVRMAEARGGHDHMWKPIAEDARTDAYAAVRLAADLLATVFFAIAAFLAAVLIMLIFSPLVALMRMMGG